MELGEVFILGWEMGGHVSGLEAVIQWRGKQVCRRRE